MQNIAYSINKFRNPYPQQLDVPIERKCGRDTSLIVNYIDSRGPYGSNARRLQVALRIVF